MALKILAQNALDGFSDVQTAAPLIALVKAEQPDAAVFPESYEEGDEAPLAAACQQLTDLGYDVLCGLYDDTDGRKDRHGLIQIVRKELVVADRPSQLVRVGGRKVAESWLRDPASDQIIHVLGVHLNDRSEAMRQTEISDLLGCVGDGPTIIAGDLNGIHSADAKGLKLRLVRWYTALVRLHLVPVAEIVSARHPKKSWGRVGSLAQRLNDIASGKTVARLEATGLAEADPKRQPTFPASHPFLQLDHIMLSSGLQATNFQVVSGGGSDHLGVMASVEIVS